jgi:hypothetical protein
MRVLPSIRCSIRAVTVQIKLDDPRRGPRRSFALEGRSRSIFVPSVPRPHRGNWRKSQTIWRPRRDLNPCYRRESSCFRVHSCHQGVDLAATLSRLGQPERAADLQDETARLEPTALYLSWAAGYNIVASGFIEARAMAGSSGGP